VYKFIQIYDIEIKQFDGKEKFFMTEV